MFWCTCHEVGLKSQIFLILYTLICGLLPCKSDLIWWGFWAQFCHTCLKVSLTVCHMEKRYVKVLRSLVHVWLLQKVWAEYQARRALWVLLKGESVLAVIPHCLQTVFLNNADNARKKATLQDKTLWVFFWKLEVAYSLGGGGEMGIFFLLIWLFW